MCFHKIFGHIEKYFSVIIRFVTALLVSRKKERFIVHYSTSVDVKYKMSSFYFLYNNYSCKSCLTPGFLFHLFLIHAIIFFALRATSTHCSGLIFVSLLT